MNYSILFNDPQSHTFTVELKISHVSDFNCKLTLPIWRPGRYEAAHYSKNITKFSAFAADNTPLKWFKVSPHVWEIETNGTSSFSIKYDYYAYQMDAGNSWYDQNLIYLNFINCLIYDPNRMDEKYSLFMDIPGNYEVATGLKGDSLHNFHADSYFQLVDCPLIASKNLHKLHYEVQGTPFYIWINGENNLDTSRLIKEFKAFSEKQVETFGEFPEPEYHFLILALPYKHYHGVEHANSTVICIGPGNDLTNPQLYKELLGVSSHELFHAWNIIKIRPLELTPYKFHEEVSFPTGYVAEGFTTYYGDLFLCRSKVFSVENYFNELNTLINRHLWNFGRLNESVTTSSTNLWVDGYLPSAPHKKSSIYIEGAMVALCLDLMIMIKTNGDKSLDDVMRILWDDFGKSQIGYNSDDIQKACESVISKDLTSFFTEHVFGTNDKEPLIRDLLQNVGCSLVETPNGNFLTKNLGIRYADTIDGTKITSIAPDSPAEKHFSVGDIIEKVNGSSIQDLNMDVGIHEISVLRNHEKVYLKVEIADNNFYKMTSIKKLANISNDQEALFEKWLGQPF